MNQRCYIAGKVSGLAHAEYRLNFRKAEIAVSVLGYEPVNPVAAVAEAAAVEGIAEPEWNWCMRIALTLFLTCDCLYVLADWKQSRGARIEVQLAKDLGMKIIYAK